MTQKGSIIIFAVLILGVIMTITLALGAIFLPKLRSATESVGSAGAAYAADSALEWCLYTQRGRLPASAQPTMSNGATYNLYFGTNPATCAPTETPLNHRAVGTFRGVSRSFIIQEQ